MESEEVSGKSEACESSSRRTVLNSGASHQLALCQNPKTHAQRDAAALYVPIALICISRRRLIFSSDYPAYTLVTITQ